MVEDGLAAGGVKVSLRRALQVLDGFIEHAEETRWDGSSVERAHQLRWEITAKLPDDNDEKDTHRFEDVTEVWTYEAVEGFCRSFGAMPVDILSLAV